MNHLTTYHLSEGIFETLQVFLIYELCNLTRVAVSKLSEPVGKLLAYVLVTFFELSTEVFFYCSLGNYDQHTEILRCYDNI